MEVNAEYKNSEEYSTALAKAAEDKLHRCSVVAERLIKTDAESSWEKFIDLYVAAEEVHDAGRVEPEPYSGPNPIIPVTPLLQIRILHSSGMTLSKPSLDFIFAFRICTTLITLDF